MTISEINFALKNLRKWMRSKKTGTNLLNFPARSYVLTEPLGVVLIIAPWNYPLQLLLVPLVGAIAAGNCAVIKPSEFAPATAALLEKMVNEIYEPGYIKLVQGDGATIIPAMINEMRFDHIFYTGSTSVGSVIYGLAAKKLIPVTLELGGKSPCIVEADANISVAARRIAMTKFSNAGQMCVAPDYVLVHEDIKEEFLQQLIKTTAGFYNTEATKDDYGKIINHKQFDRLVKYLREGTIVYGGNYDREKLFIEPTIIIRTPDGSAIMQEEIFGPILPVVSWKKEAEVYEKIKQHADPLAL
jgi:aldehyde dehydrogenase (NAD+)